MKRGTLFLLTIHKAFKVQQMEATKRYCYNPTLRWNPQVEEYFIKAYGAEHFSNISQALTRPSSYSCVRVNILRTTTDAVIQNLLEMLQETGQQNGTVGRFDLAENSKDLPEAHFNGSAGLHEGDTRSIPISKCQVPGLDYVVFVKGSGPHAIDYNDNEDKPPKEVLVSRKCAEAVLRGAQVYVPGVMACSAHVEKGDVVAVSVAVEQPNSDGGWGIGITRGTVLQGSEADPYHCARTGLYIGQGTTMMSRAGIFRASSGVAIDMHNRVFNLPSFNELLEGKIFLQNLPSIITAHALDPQEGQTILDMCAAPGGKTTAIAILMKDKGKVVAVDRSHNKVLDIQKLAAELGLQCITTYKLDALKSVCRESESDDLTSLHCIGDADGNGEQDSLGLGMAKFSSSGRDGLDSGLNLLKHSNDKQASNGRYTSKAELRKNYRKMKNGPGRNQLAGGRVEKSKGFSPNTFDRVLLDAPCSALGLRPRLFAREETLESLRNHAKYQRRMFDQAVQLVRPGGVIVYSTCTINPGENEALVRYALDTYKFLSLASQHPRIGGPGLVGRCQMSDGYIEEWLRPGEEDLVQRFDPSSSLDTIGFFIAKFNVGSKN